MNLSVKKLWVRRENWDIGDENAALVMGGVRCLNKILFKTKQKNTNKKEALVLWCCSWLTFFKFYCCIVSF